MLTHCAADANSASLGRNHEGGIGDMRAEPWVIGPQDVASNYRSLAFRNVATIRRLKPVRESLCARNGRIERVGVTTRCNRVKNRPDGVAVQRRRGSYLQHYWHRHRLNALLRQKRL